MKKTNINILIKTMVFLIPIFFASMSLTSGVIQQSFFYIGSFLSILIIVLFLLKQQAKNNNWLTRIFYDFSFLGEYRVNFEYRTVFKEAKETLHFGRKEGVFKIELIEKQIIASQITDGTKSQNILKSMSKKNGIIDLFFQYNAEATKSNDNESPFHDGIVYLSFKKNKFHSGAYWNRKPAYGFYTLFEKVE